MCRHKRGSVVVLVFYTQSVNQPQLRFERLHKDHSFQARKPGSCVTVTVEKGLSVFSSSRMTKAGSLGGSRSSPSQLDKWVSRLHSRESKGADTVQDEARQRRFKQLALRDEGTVCSCGSFQHFSLKALQSGHKRSFCWPQRLCFLLLLIFSVLCLTHQTAELRASSTPCRTTSGDAGQLSTATKSTNLPAAPRRTGNNTCKLKLLQQHRRCPEVQFRDSGYQSPADS